MLDKLISSNAIKKTTLICDKNTNVISAKNDFYEFFSCNKKQFECKYNGDLRNTVFENDRMNFAQTIVDKKIGSFRVLDYKDTLKLVLVDSCVVDDGSGNFCVDIFDISPLAFEGVGTQLQIGLFMDNFNGGVMLLELSDKVKVLYANKGIYQMSNLDYMDNVDVLDQLFLDIVPEDINIVVSKLKSAVDQDKAAEVTYRIPDVNGDYRFRHARAMQLPYKKSEYPVFVAIVMDSTEQNRAKNALEETSKTMNAIMDNVPAAIVNMNIGEKPIATYANRETYSLIGSREEEFEDDEVDITNFIHKDDIDGFFEEIRSSVKDKRTIHKTLRIVRKDGSIRWCYGRCTVINVLENSIIAIAILVDVSEQVNIQQKLDVSQEILNMAFDMTDICIWEYDIIGRIVKRLKGKRNQTYPLKNVIRDSGKQILVNGNIEHRSIEFLINLFNQIEKGEARGECILRVIRPDGGTYLVKASFVNLFDQNGKAYKAVGMTTEATDIAEEESRFAQEEILFDGMSSSSNPPIGAFKVNLTKNTLEKYTGLDVYRSVFENLETWDKIVETGKGYIGFDEDKHDLTHKFNTDKLLKSYKKGENIISANYRLEDPSGRILWTHFYVSLVKDPITRDLYLFGYARNVDKIKSAEMFLGANPEIACDSGAYSTRTVSEIDKIILKKDDPASRCVMILVEAGDYNEIVDRTSREFANQVVTFTGRIIKLLFDDVCTVGRMDESRFVIMASGMDASTFIDERLDLLKKAIQMPYLYKGQKEFFKFYIGVCNEIRSSANFELMITKAEKAITSAKTGGNVSMAMYNSPGIQPAKTANPFSPKKSNNREKSLSSAFVNSLLSLMDAKDPSAGINAIIKEIHKYYDADRTYVIEVEVGGKNCGANYEVCEPCAEPLMGNSKMLDSMPIFERASHSTEPIIIYDTAFVADAHEYEFMESKGINSIYIIPFFICGKIAGFVGVDNAKDNIKDIEPLTCLSYLIVNEVTNQHNNHNNGGDIERDAMTGHMTRSSYGDYLSQFRGDSVSTLGVVCVDVNNLKSINEDLGSYYGDKMIIELAEMLTSHFGESDVFRITGDQFLVVCWDYTYDAFTKKVQIFVNEIEQIETGTVSVGYTWADNDISLKAMAKHAEERMISAKHEYYKARGEASRHYDPDMMKSLKTAIKNNHYQMYLQPKARMINGSICGAEALIRLHDPEKGVIYPNKFIPDLEKNNMVKYIDLFIFEETLKVLDKWKKEGKKLITISLNFSRTTVCEPELLSKMQKIYEKYDVEKKYVEIEITESIGDVEIEMIKQVCNKITAQGYRLSLDDFGSQYSSLYVLTSMRFDVVKVDKSVVNDVLINPVTQTLIKGVFAICKDIGMECVAEGVETDDQFKLLRKMGCTYAQGYLFNKPIPWKEFEDKYILDV